MGMVKRIKKIIDKTILKKHKFLILILLTAILFVLITVAALAKVNYVANSSLFLNKKTNKVIQKNTSLKKIAYPSSYVKTTPTPVPQQVYNGFCLHVPVLTYHHIQPQSTAIALKQTSLNVDNGIFAQQMAYLAAHGYTTLWAPDLINALRSHSGLPPKSILITMDDGYADNDTYALPILRQYGFKANLMLSTGLVGSNSDMLSWGQVQDMKNSGVYYLTNHTWSHYPIAKGSYDKISYEIDTAATQIKQYTGQDVNIFTYPYGSFSNSAISTLQQKGYLGAFSTIPGQYQCDSFIMTLHRTRIGNAPLSSYGIY